MQNLRTAGLHAARDLGRFHTFPLVSHLPSVKGAEEPLKELSILGQNWLLSQLLLAAIKTRPKTPASYKGRPGQFQQIEKEVFSDADKSRCLAIMFSMPFQKRPRLGEIDFLQELSEYEELDYPSYYLQPFHSLPGGWLNPIAATGNQQAMEAIYRHAHPNKSIGIRNAIVDFVPMGTKRAVDFGAGTGDMAALIARRCPEVQVTAIEASPSMIIVGRRMYASTPNLEWQHGLSEHNQLEANSVDVVNISFVLHEVPDHIKRALFEAAYRILKPGGQLFVTDVPPHDLDRHRGFFEPYRRSWNEFRPDELLSAVGFEKAELRHVVDPEYMWTRIARKPR